jgi:hypothetical protein
MRGDGTREGVVLILEALPNSREPIASMASGIPLVLRGVGIRFLTVRDHMLPYPVVDPVGYSSCGGDCRHWSASLPPAAVSRVPDKGLFFAKTRTPPEHGQTGGVSGTLIWLGGSRAMYEGSASQAHGCARSSQSLRALFFLPFVRAERRGESRRPFCKFIAAGQSQPASLHVEIT